MYTTIDDFESHLSIYRHRRRPSFLSNLLLLLSLSRSVGLCHDSCENNPFLFPVSRLVPSFTVYSLNWLLLLLLLKTAKEMEMG